MALNNKVRPDTLATVFAGADIDATSRALVPRLRRAGYEVRYREFEGGHTVPVELAAEALGWSLGT